MAEQPKIRNVSTGLLAILLWLVTFGLGLESIYELKQIYILIRMRFGGSLDEANSASLLLVYLLGLAYLIFIIIFTEYHFRHVGKPESWRLFGWTLAAEVSVIALYYIL